MKFLRFIKIYSKVFYIKDFERTLQEVLKETLKELIKPF